MNLLSLDGGGHVLSSGFNGVRLPDVTVAEFEELACVGEAVFPSAPGHFLSEILPRLIVLDMLLPEHVPLLWPAGAMPEQVLGEFRAEGVLSAVRPFPLLATDGSRPQVQRARRLFTLASTVEAASWSPLILLISHRIMAESIHEVVVARDAAARAAALAVGGAAPPPLDRDAMRWALRCGTLQATRTTRQRRVHIAQEREPRARLHCQTQERRARLHARDARHSSPLP
jgi:hypothetical protein